MNCQVISLKQLGYSRCSLIFQNQKLPNVSIFSYFKPIRQSRQFIQSDQMGESLIKEGTVFHTILAEKLHSNEERTDEIKKFATSIIALLGGFSTDLTSACRSFFRKLKIDETEDENIIFLSKYIIDILNELSKKIHSINKKIELDVVDPLNQFAQNQKNNHHQTLLKSEELLYRVQSNNDMLKELNRNYQINQSALNKSNEEKQLLKEIVEAEMEACNHRWQQIKKHYQNILNELNSFNSLRCHFTMKTQIEIVRLINRLVNSTSVEESLQEYEEIFVENQTLSLEVKDQMREKLGKLIILEQTEETDICTLITSQADEKEKKIIDDFISLFTNRSALKEDQKSHQDSRTLILQEMRWTHYFLNKLKSSIQTQIKLNNSKFRQLASIIKYIFALVVEAEDNESILYNLLYISYRVRCNDQYLIKELGKHADFWMNQYLWTNIIEYIKLMKLKGKINHNYRQPKSIILKQLFNRTNWLWNRNGIFSHHKIKSEKILQQSKIYQILYEVNYYMAKLELEESFIFDFIIKQSAKFGINKQNIRKLLEYHYLNKMITTNKKNSTYLTRKLRLEEENNQFKSARDITLIAVQKSLKFLPPGPDILNILVVCKQWNQHLRKYAFRRYLIENNNHAFANKYRLKIYQEICTPPFTRKVYERMVAEVPDFTEQIDLINLDTRRSLGWDEKLRVKMIEVLKTFSYYHPDHGYLQGMNYLCENILKLTDDTYICYFIFEHLMNNQYHDMYTGNFNGLKLKIYQFMRMMERQTPQLFEHLRAEKIEGEHFMLSWAITLWGEMSGDLCMILWDGFLVEGWTWWFKMILWLMKVLEPQLSKMNFQQIMKCFSDLHSSLFSYSLDQLGQYGIQKSTIKSDIDRIRIQKNVLGEIEKQYKLRTNMINEYLKQPTKAR